MKKIKLVDIKEYIDENLISNLPVNFRNLEYTDSNTLANILKYIEVPDLETRFCISTGHHKPLSKCLSDEGE
ncbi:hypothetical protein [Pedobacter sp. KACC 23697]|uniref:Uncharacterized protein n=1 Tax=Pedobacter sp. KACC 23697 TaxID=3149230 RepID=A0AAU7K589_9SPHI